MLGYFANWMVAAASEILRKHIPLPIYGAGHAKIYEWVILARQGDRIRVMQNSPDGAGSSVAKECVCNVIVEMSGHRALGVANVLITNHGAACYCSA